MGLTVKFKFNMRQKVTATKDNPVRTGLTGIITNMLVNRLGERRYWVEWSNGYCSWTHEDVLK